MSSRIVFIDSLIVDYQSLIPQIPSDSEIVVLDRDRDGVAQILAALRSRFELDAIDIISHGTPGALMLGSGELNRANLASYAEQLTEIGTHLGDSGDILLYGCEVAKGKVGQRFIEQLAQLTGANVAASTNLTGAKDLGGDWVLGAQIGAIESSAMQLSYDGVLAGEFRVNTYTHMGRAQSSPSIATLSNGGFVVSWQSDGQDGSYYGIYAQRYSADGVAQGDEFKVNTYTANDQRAPSITALSNGGFVVSWASNGQDGSFDGVYAQRYDANGVALGDEFKVNATTAGRQENPSITALSNGGFVVSWESRNQDQDGSGYGVYAQRYDAKGAVLGNEFRVNTSTEGYQWNPSITALSNGEFVVSWDSGQDGETTDIYAQRYDATGAALGGEFRVNATTAGRQEIPSITALSNGGFVVSWQSDGQGGSFDGIYAQRYDANGAALGGEFRVNTFTQGHQWGSSITALSDGGFVVSWASDGQDGSFDGVYAQRYDANGVAQGNEFQVNTYTDGDQSQPSITGLSDGGFVVSWSSQVIPSGGAVIYAQRYDAKGNPIAAPGAPVAGNDTRDVNEDAAIVIPFADLLSNDTDPNGSAITITSIDTTGTAGSVVIDTTKRTITYTADADEFDLLATGSTTTDSFRYTLQDSSGLASVATVSMNITGVNDGNQNVLGTDRSDTLNGTPGEDRIMGKKGNDILNGNDGSDNLFGQDGNDTLNGGNGIDNLFGDNGNDILNGGNGDDWLRGDKGADTLTGGLGNDVFLFFKSGGNDIITDFANGFDRIRIKADTGKTSFDQLKITGGTDSHGVVYATVNLGDGGQVTLTGVPKASLDATDFIFAA